MESKKIYKSLSREQRKEIAAKAKTTVDYLYQVTCGKATASTELAKNIESASNCLFKKQMLRPDVWGDAA